MLLQEYLNKLQSQKSKTGSQVFNYLTDKKEGGDFGAKDQGFNANQQQILEDTEEVKLIYFRIYMYVLIFNIYIFV